MPRHTDRKPGWQARKMKADQKRAREQAAAKRGQAMTIGKGGITVKDGGNLVSRYPDDVGGGEATRFGPAIDGDERGYVFELSDEDGRYLFTAVRNLPSANFPEGISGVYVSAGQIIMSTPSGSAGFGINDDQAEVSGTEVRLVGSVNGVRIGHLTTGASANAFLDPSDGRIWRSTSSLRYKQDVADLDVDPAAVLQMQPRMWRDKAEVEQDPDTETHYVGFIAEELHDLGLTQFVVYDDEGKPEAIAYDRLSAATVSLAQQQQREIDDLKQQLGSLAERVGALESSR